ncbi:Cyclic nucleotide-binding domain-containing protein [Bradyrhizobium shewense]|uniref:Cyclic nucleotide-binding domain-containing protein n=2 Tax=Bradyrhizobium shewense TaxID=1761772 RepID=A0A1C3V1T1_9BRAD|nr:Cyclic nucleotide-binding domain-containing protein [Bradyrhizobium shewense]
MGFASALPILRNCVRGRQPRITLTLHPGYAALLAADSGGAYLSAMVVTAPDLEAFLLATPFFGGLPEPGLDLLMSMLVERRFDAGATVVAEGEPGRSLFIVKSGRLAVSKRTKAGSVIPISVLERGDFFGEMTLIEMQNRSATVVAESPTVLYELTAQNLYACYKADIHAYVIVLQNINRELCRRLRRADDRFARRAAGNEIDSA